MADKEVFFERIESARKTREPGRRKAVAMVGFSVLAFAGVLVYGTSSAIDTGRWKVASAEDKAVVYQTKWIELATEHDSSVKTYETRIATLTNAQSQEKTELMSKLDKLTTDNLALKKEVETLSKVHGAPPTIDDGTWKSKYDGALMNNRFLMIKQAELQKRATEGEAATAIVNELKGRQDIMEGCLARMDPNLHNRISTFGR